MQATIFMSGCNIIRALHTSLDICADVAVMYRVYAFELSLLPNVMIALFSTIVLLFVLPFLVLQA